MAHFYGELTGSGKTMASRIGTKATGLRAVAASYRGAVTVRLYVHEDGTDHCLVSLTPWNGAGTSRVLYHGPVDGSKAP